MASITIRNLDDTVKRKLRWGAATEPVDGGRGARYLANGFGTAARADAIRRRVELLGGIELSPPLRGPMREPPDFT
jgi:hypothetical protein